MKVSNKDVWFGGQKIVDDFAERHKAGFAHIGWNAFNRQFMYGAFSEGVYRDMA